MKKSLVPTLLLIAIAIWLAVLSKPDDKLHIIACSVGQGDALLITRKNTQILVDGGPGNSVTNCLSSHLPFWDRTIELVVLTHPQADHYSGLIDIFDNYKVKNFLGNELDSGSQGYEVLKNKIRVEGSKFLVANNDQDLELGMTYLDIVHPSINFLAQTYNENFNPDNVLGEHTSKDDPNNFSVTFTLSYGNFKMLFTGDLSPQVADELISNGSINDVDVLKVPHHGSRNGLDQKLLSASNPEVAIISVGKNQWGHPHQEVVEMLRTAGVNIYRTDENGDIEIVSDGEKYWVK